MVLVFYKPIVLIGCLAAVMHFFQAGRERETLSCTEELMTTTDDFITALFCQVDDQMPSLPERTRLFRLFRTHQDWTQVFLAAPTVLGVIDTYGIELIHPMREGRSPHQIGRKGLSNHRWIVGGTLCLLLNQWGLIVGWACATAHVADNTFQWLIRQFEDQMIVLSDTAFHAAEGDPTNLKLCQRGEWEDRLLVETVLSMLTLVCHFKKVMHRVWEYFQARLAFTMAAFNLLVQWHGLEPNASGFVPLSIAEFSL